MTAKNTRLDMLTQFQTIYLNRQEAEQFVAALSSSPKATEKLKQLFKKHEAQKNPNS